MTSTDLAIDLYRKFIKDLVELSAGGPENMNTEESIKQLINSIENNKYNRESIGSMLSGFKFESFIKNK
jgi:hypothetical protein